MNYLKFITFLLVLTSCSKDESSGDVSNGPLTVHGRVVAPNGLDPISGSKITLQLPDNTNSVGYSDAKGNFSIEIFQVKFFE